jgi:endonuclease/exonuclease/phosphatase (EEP) superfamily protein YafD
MRADPQHPDSRWAAHPRYVRGNSNSTRGIALSKTTPTRRLVVGLTTSLAVACALVARYLSLTNRPLLITAAALPSVAATGPISAALLALARRWRLAGVAATLSATALATQVTLFRAGDPPAGGPTLRVMSANVLLGQADADALVSSAGTRAAVLAVQELTAEGLARLSAAGIDKVFPHRLVVPRPRAAGIGLWSKYPISETRQVRGFRMPCIWVKLQMPHVPIDPTVVAVHLESPVHVEDWRHDIDLLSTTLRDADQWAAGGPVIVAGDFNSTLDMRPFRDALLSYSDAAQQAGAGFKPTFPGRKWIPPLFAIDHVLTLRCTASAVYTAAIAGSDHRALVATVHMPTPPAPADFAAGYARIEV